MEGDNIILSLTLSIQLFTHNSYLKTKQNVMVNESVPISSDFFFGVMKLDVVIVTQLCEYNKRHLSMCFQWMNCMVCKLRLNKAAKKK